MTKQEALDLEKRCDEYIQEALDCVLAETSRTLIGRLKISYMGAYITLADDFESVDYVRYHGYFRDLQSDVEAILNCVRTHKEDFQNLMWSYDRRNELED